MEMQMEQLTTQADRPCGMCRSQLTVEGDVAVPGSLREMTHVLHANAVPVVETAEASQDRASFTGRVIFCVLYTQGDSPKVESIEATADFTHMCDMSGATPKAEIRAYIHPEHVEASVQNGRMTIRAALRLCARAQMTETATCIAQITGRTVQQRTTDVSLYRTVAKGKRDALLREEFPLPTELQIHDTLCAWAAVHMQGTSGGEGRIGLEGEVVLEALHASDMPGKPLVVTKHTIPVREGVEMKGESGQLLDGSISVKDVAVASQDMGDGERTLRAEVLLGLSAWSDRTETISVLNDAYTVAGDDLRLTRAETHVRTSDYRIHTGESGKASILLPDGAKPVRTILAAFATPVLGEAVQQGNRMIADGTLDTTLIYMSDGEVPVSVNMAVPFRASFHEPAEADDLVLLSTADLEAIPVTSDRVELRYVLHVQIDGCRTSKIAMIMDAEPVSTPEIPSGIVLCFAQPGEDAWDIARRYRITQNELQAMNPGLTEELAPGQGLIIWRKDAV